MILCVFPFPCVINSVSINSIFWYIIMFGAIVAVSKIMSKENAVETVKSSVPPKVLDTNLKALERGFKVAEELMAQMSE